MAGPRTWGWRGAVVLTIVWTAPASWAEPPSAARTVHGKVVAVNVKIAPQVVVIKATTPKQEELIVGATRAADAKVTRGKQAIRLEALKPGEAVDLTYVKQEGGLVARSIHAP
jgi:hypothetical protein